MIVLVDLDGVVADWGTSYDYWLEHYGLSEFGPYRSRSTWDLTAGMTRSQKRTHDLIMDMTGFYRDLPVIENAQAAMDELRAIHDVFFVSTPYRSNPGCASEKMEWVKRHFGQTMQSRTILTEDKTMVQGDILIDDKPVITGLLPPRWEHLCFGEYGYSHLTESVRVNNWADALMAVRRETMEVAQ